MTESGHTQDSSETPSIGDRLLFGGLGAVLLLASLFLTYGVFFEERGQQDAPLPWTSAAAILVMFWSATVLCFSSCSNRPWPQKVGKCCSLLLTAVLAVFLLGIGLKAVLTQHADGTSSVRAAATLVVLFAFVLFAGVSLHVSGRRQAKALRTAESASALSSPDIILLWPLIFVVREPLAALLFFLFLAGFTYLGERIGEWFGHPLLGALCGTVALLFCVGVVILLVGRPGKKDKESAARGA